MVRAHAPFGQRGDLYDVDGWLKKAANAKFPLTHTSAYKFLTKMEATAGQIGEMANNVDNLGMTHADAATAFIANNRDAVDAWLK